MALPTAMTIFNRSMVNLENEIGVLNSYTIHERASYVSKSNLKFYSEGRIKTTRNDQFSWLDKKPFQFEYDIDLSEIFQTKSYLFEFYPDSNLNITVYDKNNDILSEYSFPKYDTSVYDNDLPFVFSSDFIFEEKTNKKIVISSFEDKLKKIEKNLPLLKMAWIVTN